MYFPSPVTTLLPFTRTLNIILLSFVSIEKIVLCMYMYVCVCVCVCVCKFVYYHGLSSSEPTLSRTLPGRLFVRCLNSFKQSLVSTYTLLFVTAAI